MAAAGYASLRVHGTQRISPHMQRVTFGGTDLADFTDVSPDQHSKLFFPRTPGTEPHVPPLPDDGDVSRWYRDYLALPDETRPWMRSYTIRRHRPEYNEIDIDFVLHGASAGPAARWAAEAQPGDVIGMLGPQVSHLTPERARDWTLLAGDETALPAIAALLEGLRPGERAVAYIEIADSAEEQYIDTPGAVDLHWLHRDGRPAVTSTLLEDTVRGAVFPDGDVFAWIAGKASSVRSLRRHLVKDRGVAKSAIAFSGYWRPRMSVDDPETQADLADREDQLSQRG